MKQTMVKTVGMAVIGLFCAVLGTASHAGQAKMAVPTSQTIHLITSDAVTFKLPDREVPVYNIDSNNYMKIRDIGYFLDFDVSYDTNKKTVSITTNKHNDGTQVSNGAAVSAQQATPSKEVLYVDGNKKTGLTMYNIAGNNYVKVRDLAKTVDFACRYNPYENSIDLCKFYKYCTYCVSGSGTRSVTYINGEPTLKDEEPEEEEDLHEGERIYINKVSTSGGQTFEDDKITLHISEHNPYGKKMRLVASYGDSENGHGYSNWDKDVFNGKWELSNNDTVSMKCEKDEYNEVYEIEALAVGTCELTVTAPNGEVATCTIEVIDTTFTASYLKEVREEVFRLVNELRKSEGVAPLQYADFAQEAADKRGEEILEYYSHTRPDGRKCGSVLSDFGIKSRCIGENITRINYNISPEEQAEELFYAWKCSEGHRRNMIDTDFDYIAIGLYYNGEYALDACIGCEMLLFKK